MRKGHTTKRESARTACETLEKWVRYCRKVSEKLKKLSEKLLKTGWETENNWVRNYIKLSEKLHKNERETT